MSIHADDEKDEDRERVFPTICSDVISLSNCPDDISALNCLGILKIFTIRRAEEPARGRPEFLLGRIMRDAFFNASRYKNLDAYLCLRDVRQLLYYDLGFYLCNFVILRPLEGEVIYPHIDHLNDSIKIPDGMRFGGGESVAYVRRIELLNYREEPKLGRRLEEMMDQLRQKGKHPVTLPNGLDQCRSAILDHCYSIADRVQRIVMECPVDKQTDDEVRKEMGDWKLDEVDEWLERRIESAHISMDKQQCVSAIKRWFISVLLGRLFDYELISDKPSEKYRIFKTDEQKTRFEEENACILIEDGEASLALCMEELIELKRHPDDYNKIEDHFRDFLVEQRILCRGPGELRPTERWYRMVKWVQKVYTNKGEDSNYLPLLDGKPWELLRNSKIKQLNGGSIEENIRVIIDTADETWADVRFLRASTDNWQKRFRRIGCEPLNILLLEIKRPTTQISSNLIGLFDFGVNEIEEGARREISDKIGKARTFFTSIGRVAVDVELEKAIADKVRDAAWRRSAGAITHGLKNSFIPVRSWIEEIGNTIGGVTRLRDGAFIWTDQSKSKDVCEAIARIIVPLREYGSLVADRFEVLHKEARRNVEKDEDQTSAKSIHLWGIIIRSFQRAFTIWCCRSKPRNVKRPMLSIRVARTGTQRRAVARDERMEGFLKLNFRDVDYERAIDLSKEADKLDFIENHLSSRYVIPKEWHFHALVLFEELFYNALYNCANYTQKSNLEDIVVELDLAEGEIIQRNMGEKVQLSVGGYGIESCRIISSYYFNWDFSIDYDQNNGKNIFTISLQEAES